jgi:hypothetical protein
VYQEDFDKPMRLLGSRSKSQTALLPSKVQESMNLYPISSGTRHLITVLFTLDRSNLVESSGNGVYRVAWLLRGSWRMWQVVQNLGVYSESIGALS